MIQTCIDEMATTVHGMVNNLAEIMSSTTQY